jgi:hypothetical protein
LLIVAVKSRLNPFSIATIGFLIIPSEVNNIRNLLLLFGLLGLLVYLKQDSGKTIRVFLLGLVMLLFIHFARNISDGDARISQSLIVSTSMVLSFLLVSAHRMVNSRRGSESNSL